MFVGDFSLLKPANIKSLTDSAATAAADETLNRLENVLIFFFPDGGKITHKLSTVEFLSIGE